MRTAVARREHVAELVRIVNAAYAEGEAGLWVAGGVRVRALGDGSWEVGVVSADPVQWGSGVAARS
jgi:hypothetical protein